MRWSRAGGARAAADSQSPSATEQMRTRDASLGGLGIVYVNIDWKRSRHASDVAERRNLELLKRTVTSIVTEMKPSLICFCEFGEVDRPLPDDVIPRLQDAIESAWREAALATEQGLASEGLAFAHPSGEPYLSAWRPERIDCRHHELLTGLYPASGESRTAQMFLVTAPGEKDEEGINVINVHAPSGGNRLTDSKRRQLMQAMLQSTSLRDKGQLLGHDAFIIGGDMNTEEFLMSQMLRSFKQDGVIGDKHKCVTPVIPQHGDLAVCRDIYVRTIDAQATNHDRQHVPYGIRWVPKAWLATEQPTHGGRFPDDPTETKKSRQHSRAEPSHDALDGRAASSTATASDLQPVSHYDETIPDYGGDPSTDEASTAEDPATVKEEDPATVKEGAAADLATEQTKDRETAKAIINAFLDLPTLYSECAEDSIRAVLGDEKSWPEEQRETKQLLDYCCIRLCSVLF